MTTSLRRSLTRTIAFAEWQSRDPHAMTTLAHAAKANAAIDSIEHIDDSTVRIWFSRTATAPAALSSRPWIIPARWLE